MIIDVHQRALVQPILDDVSPPTQGYLLWRLKGAALMETNFTAHEANTYLLRPTLCQPIPYATCLRVGFFSEEIEHKVLFGIIKS